MSEEKIVISKATYNEVIKTFSAIGWGGLRDRLVKDAEKARADGDGVEADRSAQVDGNHNSALSRRSEADYRGEYDETIKMLRWYVRAMGVNDEEMAMASQAVLREFEAAEKRIRERSDKATEAQDELAEPTAR